MADTVIAARLSTTITCTLPTITWIPVGLLSTGHPTVDIRVQDTRNDPSPIRPPDQPKMVASRTIVLAPRQFLRRGLTTKRRRGRPIRILPNLISPRRARFLTTPTVPI